MSLGADGINTLFTPTHQLLYQDWVVNGNYPGSGTQSNSGGVGMGMTDYTVSMMYLEEIKRTFGREYSVSWNQYTQNLKITPCPKTDLVGLLFIWKKISIEQLFNNINFRRLCVGEAKKTWGGLILSKTNMNLPGGGQFNGQFIYEQGVKEYDSALDDIIHEVPATPMLIA